MSRNELLLAAVTALTATVPMALAQHSGWPPSPDHVTLPVWPGAAPGAPANLPPEADITTAKDNIVASHAVIRLGNVVKPTITRGFDYRAMSWTDLPHADAPPVAPVADANETLTPVA